VGVVCDPRYLELCYYLSGDHWCFASFGVGEGPETDPGASQKILGGRSEQKRWSGLGSHHRGRRPLSG
jgi:hypothetical protein